MIIAKTDLEEIPKHCDDCKFNKVDNYRVDNYLVPKELWERVCLLCGSSIPSDIVIIEHTKPQWCPLIDLEI